MHERLLSVSGLTTGFGLIIVVNWLLNGMNWNFIEDTYGFILKVDDLTPNVGLVCSTILSISVLHNLIAAAFVFYFSTGLLLPCLALLSFSSSLSLYPVVILASILLRFPSIHERLLAVAGLTTGFGFIIVMNWLLNGMNWSFIEDTYVFILKVDDLTPNVGLVWYFFTQVFEHFRVFYLAVFQINLLVYVVPLLLSLRKDAHLHLVVSLLLVAVFSSYPTLNDASVYLALLPMLEKYHKCRSSKLFTGFLDGLVKKS
ncbi:unnamed protein product [Strongylus vulgaris]|uniref:GPI transamidase subunit PIG-U n=1 Tax=Strongylus vulgaris TaxID=40348 RepID=A0A3P7LVV4_STRVU|nr:unnamed protein product [Strongylus vulgaris]